MNFVPHKIYHIYNQGNNQQTIFWNRNDFLIFLRLYKRLFPASCSTIAWCLMPNHFHFMILSDERCSENIKQGNIIIDPVTNSVRKLLSGYARIFNNRYKQTGSVFRQKTKAKCLSDLEITPDSKYQVIDYYVNCFHYIHQNPVKAGLGQKMQDWEFSSFRDYAGIRNGSLCQKELAIKHCGYQPDDFFEKSNKDVDAEVIRLFT